MKTNNQPKPLFSIGDTVKHPKSLYDETEGKIVEVERIYQQVNKDGSFDMHGLAHLENTISSICLPYRFDGETLEVDYPESEFKLTNGVIKENAYTMKSRFYGWAYTVETAKMRCVFSQRQLRKISK